MDQRKYRLSVLAFFMVIMASLISACTGGTNSQESSTPSVTTTNDNQQQEQQSSTPVPRMPSLIGKQLEDAKATLGPNVRFSVRNQISQKPAGTVLEQSPPYDEQVPADNTVALTVAISPPAVPDVTRKTFGDAKAALEKLGFSVVEHSLEDDSKADGTVVKQDPPAGDTSSGEITLQVVRTPLSTSLTALPLISSQPSYQLEYDKGTQKTNGKSYPHSILVKQTLGGINTELQYNLEKKYLKFEGLLGISDDAPISSTARIEFYDADRELKSVTVTFGNPIPITLDVTDVLRLRIDISPSDSSFGVIFADARIQYFPDSSMLSTPTPSASEKSAG